jgi:endonuclease/exonuclease/phosphatase family metal-dependent hydrolase
MSTTVASFNVENLFARPRAFTAESDAVADQVLAAYREFNTLIARAGYSDADRERMRELLLVVDVYHRNSHGAIRRKRSTNPAWAWLRKNRGTFDREPTDPTQDVVVEATGRRDWIGWLELATETVNEIGTRMTARVIAEIDADILGIVEAEDRPSMRRFNSDLLARRYRHLMLVDGNDERGIDVGLFTRTGFPIGSIRSHVDDVDGVGQVFSRDCCDYAVTTPAGTVLHVLVNHFKSQSGGGGSLRLRQATRVRSIVNGLVAAGEHVIVMGDLNEGPKVEGEPPPNLATLFDPAGPLVSCFDLPGFDIGNRPGTYAPCGLRDRIDYILLSRSLEPAFLGGRVFRRGVWGDRVTRPTAWETYPEMTESVHQASDHSAVVVELDV